MKLRQSALVIVSSSIVLIALGGGCAEQKDLVCEEATFEHYTLTFDRCETSDALAPCDKVCVFVADVSWPDVHCAIVGAEIRADSATEIPEFLCSSSRDGGAIGGMKSTTTTDTTTWRVTGLNNFNTSSDQSGHYEFSFAVSDCSENECSKFGTIILILESG